MSKVFISATSADLAQARTVAKLGLETINLETVEQGSFETDYGEMLDRLRRKLNGCDAIVHIAGLRYGAEPDPATLPPGTPRRSYTQWEYHVALEIQKRRKHFRIYAFLTADDYPSAGTPEAPGLQALQQAHRALLNPVKAGKISNDDQLRERCKEIQLEVETLRRQQQRMLWALAALLVPIVVIALGGGLNQYACQAPGIHAICKQYGWGGVPTLAEEAALMQAAQGGCDGLRAYLRGNIPERLRERAENALEAREIRHVDTWELQPEVPMPITLDPLQAPPEGDEATAHSASARALLADAQQRCSAQLATNLYRMPKARELVRLEDARYQCSQEEASWRCGAQAAMVCQADVLSNNQEEICRVAP